MRNGQKEIPAEEQKKFHRTAICPIRDILARLGDKWSLLVLVSLSANGTMRFGELRGSIGDISQRMLTVTLRSLEIDGLVSRLVHAEVPPRVEYSLTPRGASLMPHLQALVVWALENAPEIIVGREDSAHPCPV